MHFGFSTIEDKLNKDSLEAVTKRDQNQLRNLNISNTWRRKSIVSSTQLDNTISATTPRTTPQCISQLAPSNKTDKPVFGVNLTNRQLTKPTFLPSLNELHSALKEDTKTFSNGIFTKPQLSARSLCKIRKSTIDESDDDDVEVNCRNSFNEGTRSNRSAYSSSYRLNSESPRSKTSSMQSIHETLLEKNIYNSLSYANEFSTQLAELESDSFLSSRNKGMPFDLAAAAARDVEEDVVESGPIGVNEPHEDPPKLNVIMLLGLFVGLLVSKSLKYIELYLGWFMAQVDHMRNMFLGSTSIWDFLNLDDTTRFKVRTKLLLMPFIGVCGILYAVVFMLHFSAHFLLMTAPNALTKLVRKLQPY